MKKMITAALCLTMLLCAFPASAVSDPYPELTLSKASALEVDGDGYIGLMRSGTSASELAANFCDAKHVTVTAKDGTPLTLTDTVGSDAVVSYSSGTKTLKTVLLGDVNGDGKIGIKDSAALMCAGAGFGTDLCERAADVNGDGKGDSKDAADIMKYSVGWDVSIENPVRSTATSADGKFRMYFTAIMNRVGRSDVSVPDTGDLVFRMAKNEVETAELIVISDNAVGDMTLSVGALTNENGAKLDFDVMYGYYYKQGIFNSAVGKDYQNFTENYNVDPLPPLDGPFDLFAGESKTFAIRIKAPTDAEAGFYMAPVELRDMNKKVVCETVLRVYVWDFALDEKPASSSAFGMGFGAPLADLCGGDLDKMNSFSSDEIFDFYSKWYEFLLSYRITGYNLPCDIEDPRAEKYVNDPRVTSFCAVGGMGVTTLSFEEIAELFKRHKDDENWIKKAYIYTVDEPYRDEQFEYLQEQWDTLKSLIPDIPFNVVCPLAGNAMGAGDDARDRVDMVASTTTILCPQSPAFCEYTTKAQREDDPVRYPKYQGDGFTPHKVYAKYGQFADRWEQYRAEGKTAWWYICCSPEFPYANFFNYYQGVYDRMVLWQQYLFHVDGLLYWDTIFWHLGETDYTPISRTKTNGGDGMLIYPGSLFGMPGEPIPTIRLESVRDGFEDFQYMSQLERVIGRDAVLEYVTRNTDAILHYTENPDDVTSVRDEMGFLLEALGR